MESKFLVVILRMESFRADVVSQDDHAVTFVCFLTL